MKTTFWRRFVALTVLWILLTPSSRASMTGSLSVTMFDRSCSAFLASRAWINNEFRIMRGWTNHSFVLVFLVPQAADKLADVTSRYRSLVFDHFVGESVHTRGIFRLKTSSSFSTHRNRAKGTSIDQIFFCILTWYSALGSCHLHPLVLASRREDQALERMRQVVDFPDFLCASKRLCGSCSI